MNRNIYRVNELMSSNSRENDNGNAVAFHSASVAFLDFFFLKSIEVLDSIICLMHHAKQRPLPSGLPFFQRL